LGESPSCLALFDPVYNDDEDDDAKATVRSENGDADDDGY
jgi:hypothetical protein